MTISISPARRLSRCPRSASPARLSAPPQSSCCSLLVWKPRNPGTWCSARSSSRGLLLWEWSALADQCLDVVETLPDVDVHPGEHPVFAVEPEHGELQGRDVATEN